MSDSELLRARLLVIENSRVVLENENLKQINCGLAVKMKKLRQQLEIILKELDVSTPELRSKPVFSGINVRLKRLKSSEYCKTQDYLLEDVFSGDQNVIVHGDLIEKESFEEQPKDANNDKTVDNAYKEKETVQKAAQSGCHNLQMTVPDDGQACEHENEQHFDNHRDVDEFLGDDVNVEFTMVGEVDHASTSEDGNDISEEIYIETASEFHLEAKLEKVTACSPNPNTNTVPDFSANTTDLEEIQAGLASSLKENTVTVCPKEEPALPIPLIEQNLETKNEVQQAYPCTECEFTAKNLKGLKKHKTCKHKRDLFIANKNADGFYECIKCPEPWKTKLKGKFAIHMRKHEGKAFICKKCSFETFSKLTLKNHKAIHVKRSKFIDKDKYKCDKCGYSTGYKRAFYDHLELHEGVEYKCNLCQYSSCSSHNLQKHMSRTHSTLKLYCDKCSYVAKTRELLTNHMKIHERKPANEIRFVCDKCEYKTHSRLNFKNHIETHGSVLHFCEKCVYSTPSSLYLKKHVYRQHTVQRYEPELGDPTTFECDQCNYTTSRDANLKVHIRRTHTLRLPDGALFKCQACNYRSKSYDSLGEHMKESHADNMPQTKHYACERCSYTTWDGGNLRIHMRKHATVCLPCSECNFTTDSAENMRAHTRRKHRDDPKKELDI